jgi:hypothetical protein
MKRFVCFIVGLFLLSCLNIAYSAEEGQKGASSKAYEHASENAIFNRITDWFATVGKSKEEKEAILADRKAQRAAKRAQKEAQKATEDTEEEAERIREQTSKRVQEETRSETANPAQRIQSEVETQSQSMKGPNK